MEPIVNSEAFILALNIGAYYFGCAVIKQLKIKYVSGLLIAIVLVSVAVPMLGIDYAVYEHGSRILNFLLGPSVVALGYVLHKHIGAIRRNLTAIVVGITIGVVVNVLAVNGVMKLFGSEVLNIYSIQPKSVTSPIAISLSESSGAVVPLTVVAVVVAGLLGSIIGAPLLRMLRVKNAVARGAAMGSAAHAIGTAKALEMGAVEGAVSGLAIGLTGVITAVLLPLITNLLL